ncbi:TlpA family protein disulfide reductase [Pseudolysinimonas yzui]|uniref:Thiol reductase thioredoxin n=1 Tax=Pseudolysinimonas yzui TaxID=2708254 RepID=A0A8J3GPG1_9MICO|nr:thioredoxin family protein [Pseudolysinimonas yzui]GHF11340.1 thiol reductase thioredoxin [Pseudolysinimonas yzui]
MDVGTVALALGGLVLAATLLGFLHRATQGRARTISDARIVSIDGVSLGGRATLLQFSTEVCAPCKSTARVLDDLAARTEEVTHVDLDVTHRPELASRYRVLQTPTTLILDADGTVRARIGGAVRRDVVIAELQRVLAA